MSNDNKTLADVQPGGRVRLGDQAERARFEAWAEDSYHLQRMGDVYRSAITSDAWRAWQAALSAQPSPGGQGDAVHCGKCKGRGYVDVDVDVDESGSSIGNIESCPHCALAARQPVGEPFGWWLADENGIGHIARNPGQGVIDVYRARPGCSAMPLYTAPTAQQPAQVHLDGLDRALGEAIDQRDRYHEVADDLAGHIAAIAGVDIGEHSSANCPWQNAIEAAEEYKPAQAVDLGPRPMNTAPQDGTMVRLLVNFDENATEDTAEPAWTIGACNDDNVGEDERTGWQFAGWCWTHDHFTEGKGTPVGWLPLVGAPAQAVDLGQLPRVIELLSNVSRTLVDWAADEQQEAIGIVKALIDGKAVGK